MAKKKPTVTPEPVPQLQPIPEDLQHQISALKAISTIHKLIVDGRYPHTFLEDVKQSLKFLESLHVQSLEQALSHPDADKVPELLAVTSQRSATNGQK